jgi:hypothetical protein
MLRLAGLKKRGGLLGFVVIAAIAAIRICDADSMRWDVVDARAAVSAVLVAVVIAATDAALLLLLLSLSPSSLLSS